jgi:integrase
LSSTDCKILEFVVALKSERLLDDAADMLESLTTPKVCEVISVVLDEPIGQIRAALGPKSTLIMSGLVGVDNSRERSLTPEQAKRLLHELPGHQREFVLFVLATGLRQSNVFKLEWARVNLELRHAWVQGTQSKNCRPISVPLSEVASDVLKRQVGKHRQRVFTFRGRAIHSANTKAWHAALKRAGIEDFRWPDLRHTWATWQRQAGTPTHELQRLGGWRTGAMVERYAHLAPEHLALAASWLDSVLEAAATL